MTPENSNLVNTLASSGKSVCSLMTWPGEVYLLTSALKTESRIYGGSGWIGVTNVNEGVSD